MLDQTCYIAWQHRIYEACIRNFLHSEFAGHLHETNKTQATQISVVSYFIGLSLSVHTHCSCVWDLNVSVINLVHNGLGVHAVDGAANRACCAEDLLHGAAQVAGHGALLHDTGNVDHLIQGDVAVVLHCNKEHNLLMQCVGKSCMIQKSSSSHSKFPHAKIHHCEQELGTIAPGRVQTMCMFQQNILHGEVDISCWLAV